LLRGGEAHVPKTLLAVDDSITMRKVLEITFAGDDFRVVAADGSQSALARLSDGPIAAIIDAGLDGDGYALAKEMRARDPRLAIVLLASRYNPYDANRGREAGADDYHEKPFDTQALIDKVKRAIATRESAKAAAVAAPPPQAPPVAAPVPPAASRAPAPPAPQQRQAFPTQRGQTLSFEGSPPGSPPAISRTIPSITPIVAPAQQPRPPAAPTPAQPPAAEHMVGPGAHAKPLEVLTPSTADNGQLAGKLRDLGLTAQQIDAVLALSRDVVERVVWEVVPQLAEALIKEEIARLTKEG
jgi:CheY-like chemotaxis protein